MVISKADLTKKMLESADIPITDSNLKTFHLKFWKNIRPNDEGSVGLTVEGFSFAKKIMKFYNVPINNPYQLNGRNIINLDRYIKYPYHLTKKCIHLSNQHEAVELILHSGNLNNYLKIRSMSNQ